MFYEPLLPGGFHMGQNMADNRKFRRGTAAIEYALLAALVIGVVLLAVSTLGEHSSRAMAQLFQVQDARSTSPTNSATTKAMVWGWQGNETSPRFDFLVHAFQLLLASGLVLGIGYQSLLSFRKVRQPNTEAVRSPDKQPHPLDRLFEKRHHMLKDLEQIIGAHHLADLKVGQVMTNNLTVVGKSTSTADLERLLHSERRHHILVTGDNDQLAGIISDRDLSRRDGDCASEVMTCKITMAAPETELIVAASTMINQGISAMPVVDNGKLVGILTTTDLTLVLQCILLLAKREEALV